MPASLSKMRVAKPIYKTLDGWNDINNDQVNHLCNKGYDALPDTMKQYIDFIEKEVDCPITIISLGRERNQTILR